MVPGCSPACSLWRPLCPPAPSLGYRWPWGRFSPFFAPPSPRCGAHGLLTRSPRFSSLAPKPRWGSLPPPSPTAPCGRRENGWLGGPSVWLRLRGCCVAPTPRPPLGPGGPRWRPLLQPHTGPVVVGRLPAPTVVPRAAPSLATRAPAWATGWNVRGGVSAPAPLGRCHSPPARPAVLLHPPLPGPSSRPLAPAPRARRSASGGPWIPRLPSPVPRLRGGAAREGEAAAVLCSALLPPLPGPTPGLGPFRPPPCGPRPTLRTGQTFLKAQPPWWRLSMAAPLRRPTRRLRRRAYPVPPRSVARARSPHPHVP